MKEEIPEEVGEHKTQKKVKKEQKRKRDVDDAEEDRPLKKHAAAPAGNGALHTPSAPHGEVDASDARKKKKKKKERAEVMESTSVQNGEHQLSEPLQKFMVSRYKKEPKQEQHQADTTKGDQPTKTKKAVGPVQAAKAQTSTAPNDEAKPNDQPPKKKKKERSDNVTQDQATEVHTPSAPQIKTETSDQPRKKKKERENDAVSNQAKQAQAFSEPQDEADVSSLPPKKNKKKERSDTTLLKHGGDAQNISTPRSEAEASVEPRKKQKKKKELSRDATSKHNGEIEPSAPQERTEANTIPPKKKKDRSAAAMSNQGDGPQSSSAMQGETEISDKPRKKKKQQPEATSPADSQTVDGHSKKYVTASSQAEEPQASTAQQGEAETNDAPSKKKKKKKEGDNKSIDPISAEGADLSLDTNAATTGQIGGAHTTTNPAIAANANKTNAKPRRKKIKTEDHEATASTSSQTINRSADNGTVAPSQTDQVQKPLSQAQAATTDRPRNKKKKERSEVIESKDPQEASSLPEKQAVLSSQPGSIQTSKTQNNEAEESGRSQKQKRKREDMESTSIPNADQSGDRALSPRLERFFNSRLDLGGKNKRESSSPQPSLLKASNQGKEKKPKAHKHVPQSSDGGKKEQLPAADESTNSGNGAYQLSSNLEQFMNSRYTKEPKETPKSSSQKPKSSKKSSQIKAQQIKSEGLEAPPTDSEDGASPQIEGTRTNITKTSGKVANGQLKRSTSASQNQAKTSKAPKQSSAVKSNVSSKVDPVKQNDQTVSTERSTSGKKSKKTKQPSGATFKSEEFVSTVSDSDNAQESQLPLSQKASQYDSNTRTESALDESDSERRNGQQAIPNSKKEMKPHTKPKNKTKAAKKTKNEVAQEPSDDTPESKGAQDGNQKNQKNESASVKPVKSKRKAANAKQDHGLDLASVSGTTKPTLSSQTSTIKPEPSSQPSATASIKPAKSTKKAAAESSDESDSDDGSVERAIKPELSIPRSQARTAQPIQGEKRAATPSSEESGSESESESDDGSTKSATKPELSSPKSVAHPAQPAKGKKKAVTPSSEESESDDGSTKSKIKPEVSSPKGVAHPAQSPKGKKRAATPSSEESDDSSTESTTEHKQPGPTNVTRPTQLAAKKETTSSDSEESDASSTDSDDDNANETLSANVGKTHAGEETAKKEEGSQSQDYVSPQNHTPEAELPSKENELLERSQEKRKRSHSISSTESSNAMSDVQTSNDKRSRSDETALQQGRSLSVDLSELPDAIDDVDPLDEERKSERARSDSISTTDSTSDLQTSNDKIKLPFEEPQLPPKLKPSVSSNQSSRENSPATNGAQSSNKKSERELGSPPTKREESVPASSDGSDESSNEELDESAKRPTDAVNLRMANQPPPENNQMKRERSLSSSSVASSNAANKVQLPSKERKVSIDSSHSSTASTSDSDSDVDQSLTHPKSKTQLDKIQNSILPTSEPHLKRERSLSALSEESADAMHDVQTQNKEGRPSMDSRNSTTVLSSAASPDSNDSEADIEEPPRISDAEVDNELVVEEDLENDDVSKQNVGGHRFNNEVKVRVSDIGEWGPVIAYSPGLSVQIDRPLNAYSKRRDSPANQAQKTPWTKELALHDDSHPTLDYTAREECEAGAGSDLQHFIGLYRPETNEIEIIPTRRMIIRSTLKKQPDEPDDQSDLTAIEKKQALQEAFGTKKSQKLVRSLQENAIVSNAKTTQGAEGKPVLDASVSAVLDSMDRPAAVSRKDMQAITDAHKPIPNPNLEAKRPQDVYTAESLVGERALRLVAIREWQEAIEKNQAPKTVSRFVSRRMNTVVKSGNATKTRMLKYLQTLVDWKQSLIPNKKGGGYKLPSKPKDEGTLKDNEGLVREAIRAKFAPEAQLTKWHTDYLVTHICALALLIDDLETDICDIREDLNLELAQTDKYYKELGCDVKALPQAQIEKLKITKATASSKHRMARLKLPLVFPQPPRKRQRR